LLELEEIEDILKRVEMLISSKEFQKIADGEIFKEQALSFNNNLRYIDLLIKYDNSWAVLDYKTSKLYADKHKAQVLYYVDAIKTITGNKVDGYICYLLKESIEIVKV
jgi:exodeoxyribonuclease V beta subunit